MPLPCMKGPVLLQELVYPQLYRYILHPCVSWPGTPNMCGGLHSATGDLQFDSFLTQEDVVIMLIYEVNCACLSVAQHCKLKGPSTGMGIFACGTSWPDVLCRKAFIPEGQVIIQEDVISC